MDHNFLPSKGLQDLPSSVVGEAHDRNHGDRVKGSSRHGYPLDGDAWNEVVARACEENRTVHLDLWEGVVVH